MNVSQKRLKVAVFSLLMLSMRLYAAASSGDENMIHSLVKRDSKSSITKFPQPIFGHFCQGVFRAWAQDQKKLETVKKNALRATKANTMKISVPDKEAYDYVHCLQQLENTGLVAKPFETWSVADIQQVNAWLTRLQVDEPGKFREVDTAWPIRDLSPAEQLRLAKIQDQTLMTTVPLSPEDDKFLAQTVHFFPPASKVLFEVQELLKDVSGALQQWQSSPVAKKIHDEVNIASYVHHKIVAIHPWHEANKRTGRVLSYVILMQKGIQPPMYMDAKKYVALFLENLKTNDCSPLSAYTRDLIVARQQTEIAAGQRKSK